MILVKVQVKTQEELLCRIYLRTNILKKANQVVVVNEYPGHFSPTRSNISGETRGHLKRNDKQNNYMSYKCLKFYVLTYTGNSQELIQSNSIW